MAKAKAGRGRAARRPAPPTRPARRPRPRLTWLAAGAALLALVAAGAFLVARNQGDDSTGAAAPESGLPNTPDYHSLLVSPTDPERLILGTHAGLYGSNDGGESWSRSALAGRDAMNLVAASSGVVWTAGHEVLARSTDGGATWTDVHPAGLPSLDVHGFARDPGDPNRLYAAVAGHGLYRSDDAGTSFALVSREVGPAVFGLAVLPDGRILAGDTEQGLLASDDGGKTWRLLARFAALGLAVNPDDSKLILAAGQGTPASGILLSHDGGRTWTSAKSIAAGAGPAAWSASDPRIGYVVGFDRRLYRTNDSGATWTPVAQGG